MKLVALAWMFWSSPAMAQVAIAHQPNPAEWYGEATSLLKQKTIPAADLPKLKPGPVAATLSADLSAFDWIEAGSYSYTDAGVDAGYGAASPCQINLHRYLPSGGALRFGYVAPCAAVTAGQIVHLNFQDPPVTTTTVTYADGVTWLKSVSYGETSQNRVVSYADGVLVVDVSRDGKRASKPGLRMVYLAMPKKFDWKFGE